MFWSFKDFLYPRPFPFLNNGYRVPYFIVFRPDINAIKGGDKFNISITCLYSIAGIKQTLNYSAEFFKLN